MNTGFPKRRCRTTALVMKQPPGTSCAIATGLPIPIVSLVGQPAYPHPYVQAVDTPEKLVPVQPTLQAPPDDLTPLGPISYTPAGQFEDPYAVRPAGQASAAVSIPSWLLLAGVAGGLFWLATRKERARR